MPDINEYLIDEIGRGVEREEPYQKEYTPDDAEYKRETERLKLREEQGLRENGESEKK